MNKETFDAKEITGGKKYLVILNCDDIDYYFTCICQGLSSPNFFGAKYISSKDIIESELSKFGIGQYDTIQQRRTSFNIEDIFTNHSLDLVSKLVCDINTYFSEGADIVIAYVRTEKTIKDIKEYYSQKKDIKVNVLSIICTLTNATTSKIYDGQFSLINSNANQLASYLKKCIEGNITENNENYIFYVTGQCESGYQEVYSNRENMLLFKIISRIPYKNWKSELISEMTDLTTTESCYDLKNYSYFICGPLKHVKDLKHKYGLKVCIILINRDVKERTKIVFQGVNTENQMLKVCRRIIEEESLIKDIMNEYYPFCCDYSEYDETVYDQISDTIVRAFGGYDGEH